MYLDYAATTPVDERVLDAMLPYFRDEFGNPSSIHRFGQKAEAALEDARESVARALNCTPKEIIFTSCGSESDNLALRGSVLKARQERNASHILISPVEHHAVTHTAQQLALLHGFELEYLPVNEFGQVEIAALSERIRPETAVVSVIFANNEIGTLNPVAEIAAVCRDHNVVFHSDAVQAAAYLPVNVQDLNVDLLAIGAHKFYGPKGVGVLYVRRGIELYSHLTGGSQEFGLRAGTSNIPYIVGLAKALELAQADQEGRRAHLSTLRDKIILNVLKSIPDARLTGHPVERLPNHASFVFAGVDGNALLNLLDMEGFACSSGSACKTGDPEPSGVLLSLGLEPDLALGSLRVTLGTPTMMAEVDSFLGVLPTVIRRVRTLSANQLK